MKSLLELKYTRFPKNDQGDACSVVQFLPKQGMTVTYATQQLQKKAAVNEVIDRMIAELNSMRIK